MKPIKGIVVDASTLGNPGESEYKGICLESGEILFEKKIGHSTNNITEFIALVHALSYVKKNNDNRIVFSDSKTALAWVRDKKVNSKLVSTENTKSSLELMERALKWLISEGNIPEHKKWETDAWGENPADFGRK